MINKRKHELERDDFIFKNEKKIHKNPFEDDLTIERNLYEFNKQFETLKEYITLFNRISNKKQNFHKKNVMEIETKEDVLIQNVEKSNNEQKFIMSENFKNEKDSVIICEEFGKINNITN